MQVWFYEHIRRFAKEENSRFPRIVNWDRVDHGGRYDAELLLKDITEDEVRLSSSNMLE